MADSLSGPATLLSQTIGELAERLDLSARDALDDVINAGVRSFWHEGRKFDLESLRAYLQRRHFFDPVSDLDVELNSDQVQWLAAMADIDPAVLTSWHESAETASRDKPLRKFVASQSELDAAAVNQQSRVG